MLRASIACLLAALAVGAARADERRGTIYLRDGEPPLLVLAPPIERWVYQVRPDPGEPALFLSLLDVEFGTRVDFREYPRRAGEDPAERLARRVARELSDPAEPVREERPFGPSGEPRPVWSFEGLPAGDVDPAIGRVAHEFWLLGGPERAYVVAFRVPEYARSGRAAELTRAALEYVRASMCLKGEEERE